MKKILVTGSLGQIGSELVPYLRSIYGKENVIATDLRKREGSAIVGDGVFEELDVMSIEQFRALVTKHKVDTIIHLAALLSAKMEERPLFGWNLNMGGLFNCLEVAKEFKLSLFVPSSIAAFGPTSPADNTPPRYAGATHHHVWDYQSGGGIALRLLL